MEPKKIKTQRFIRTLSDSEVQTIDRWAKHSDRSEILGQIDRLQSRIEEAYKQEHLDRAARYKSMIDVLNTELDVRLHGEIVRPQRPQLERPRPHIFPNGEYTAEVSTNIVFSIRISTDFRLIRGGDGAVPGGQMISYLGDDDEFIGCAFLLQRQLSFWKRHRNTMTSEYVRRMLSIIENDTERERAKELYSILYG